LPPFTDAFPQLAALEDSVGVPKEYLALGALATFLLLVLMASGVGSLTSIVGFVYPTLMSFRAIETKQKGDDTQWLIYWTVYGFFTVLETFVDYVLYFVPFYYAFKLAFLVYLMHPQTRGAEFLYNSFLRDFLKKNESRIDDAINRAGRGASSVSGEAMGAAAELAHKGVVAGTKALGKDE
jgi:receptor expression-enhancing protein 5/6